MKVEFTKEQYASLMKLVYLGNYMANGNRMDDEVIDDFNDLEDYIFGKAKEAGLERYVDEGTNEDEGDPIAYPSELLDEEVSEYIEEFESQIFWDELIDLLTKRDMIKKYGEDKLEAMEIEDLISKESEIYDKYAEEFNDKGIENLYLK